MVNLSKANYRRKGKKYLVKGKTPRCNMSALPDCQLKQTLEVKE